ncbi:hypothetical protein KEM55_005804, partial [Ascosphaera atra]
RGGRGFEVEGSEASVVSSVLRFLIITGTPDAEEVTAAVGVERPTVTVIVVAVDVDLLFLSVSSSASSTSRITGPAIEAQMYVSCRCVPGPEA